MLLVITARVWKPAGVGLDNVMVPEAMAGVEPTCVTRPLMVYVLIGHYYYRAGKVTDRKTEKEQN